MTEIEVKKWLSRAYRIEQQIQSKTEQIEVWKSLANKMTSNLSLINSGSGDNSRMETYCIKIADAQAEITRQQIELINVRKEIEDTINKVQNVTSRLLLEQRYLLCKSWEDIAEFMELSVEYIKRKLHSQAIKDITKILQNTPPKCS